MTNYTPFFSKRANSDLRKIRYWYLEESISAEGGFMDEMDRVIQKIAHHPHRFSPVPKKDARIARLKRFPYKVFFRINELMQRIEIVAIIHNERHPRVWQRRLHGA